MSTGSFRLLGARLPAASLAALAGLPHAVFDQTPSNPTEAANLAWGAKAAPGSGLLLEAVRYPGDPEPGPVRPTIIVP